MANNVLAPVKSNHFSAAVRPPDERNDGATARGTNYTVNHYNMLIVVLRLLREANWAVQETDHARRRLRVLGNMLVQFGKMTMPHLTELRLYKRM